MCIDCEAHMFEYTFKKQIFIHLKSDLIVTVLINTVPTENMKEAF